MKATQNHHNGHTKFEFGMTTAAIPRGPHTPEFAVCGYRALDVTEVASYCRLKMVRWCHQMIAMYSSWELGVTDSGRVLLPGVTVMFVTGVAG